MEQPNVLANESDMLDNVLFSSLLSQEEKELLLGNSTLVEYSRRDTIIKQNARTSHVLYIYSGLVKVSREMRKGKNLLLRIDKGGAFIGLSSIFSGEVYHYSASVLEPTTILSIDPECFMQLIKTNGEFAASIIQQLSTDNISDLFRVSSLLYKQLPGRVADIILYFAEEIYHSNTFSFPLTRQELAELAGTTKESLIRTMSEFKHDKIIEMDRNQITITSPKIINTLSRLG